MQNIVRNILIRYLNKFLYFIFFILLASKISPKEYGELNYLMSICYIFFIPFLSFGFEQSIAKHSARNFLNNIDVIFGYQFILASLFSLIIIFFLKNNLLFNIFLFLTFQTVILMILTFFRGKNFLKEEFLIFLFNTVLFIGLILYVFPEKLINLNYTILILIVIYFFTFLYSFYQYFFKREKNFINYKNFFWENIQYFIINIIWIIYYKSDLYLLGLITDDYNVGIYSAPLKIVEGFYFLVGVLMSYIFPRLCVKKIFNKIYKHYLILLFITGFFFSLIIYILSSKIIFFIFGENYKNSIIILRILSLSIFFVFLGNISTQALIAIDKGKNYLYLSIVIVFFNLILSLIFIYKFQAVGAAIATVCSEGIMALVALVLVEKYKWN